VAGEAPTLPAAPYIGNRQTSRIDGCDQRHPCRLVSGGLVEGLGDDERDEEPLAPLAARDFGDTLCPSKD
jgi:hypothetical protein